MRLSRLYSSSQILAALICMQLLAITACFAQNQYSEVQVVDGYRTIDWVDLIPGDDLEALLNPPDYIEEIADGSPEDQIVLGLEPATPQAENPIGRVEKDTLQQLGDTPEERRYQKALLSQRVIGKFDGQAVRIPGFIVPLEFDNSQKVTQFFLVPYFGACLHMPPPPPNQIIFAEAVGGVEMASMYDPVWISGVLRTTLIENDMATAAYAIEVTRLEAYTE